MEEGGHWQVHGRRDVEHDLMASVELARAVGRDWRYAPRPAADAPADGGRPVPLEDRYRTLELVKDAFNEIAGELRGGPVALPLQRAAELAAGHENPALVLDAALLAISSDETLGQLLAEVNLIRDAWSAPGSPAGWDLAPLWHGTYEKFGEDPDALGLVRSGLVGGIDVNARPGAPSPVVMAPDESGARASSVAVGLLDIARAAAGATQRGPGGYRWPMPR